MSAASGTTSTGDKVTLALIGQKLNDVVDSQHEILAVIKDIGKEIHRLDNEQCVQAKSIDTIEKDIKDSIKPSVASCKENYDKLDEKVDDLRVRDNRWNGANTILSTIAGILAALGIGK